MSTLLLFFEIIIPNFKAAVDVHSCQNNTLVAWESALHYIQKRCFLYKNKSRCSVNCVLCQASFKSLQVNFHYIKKHEIPKLKKKGKQKCVNVFVC